MHYTQRPVAPHKMHTRQIVLACKLPNAGAMKCPGVNA